MNNEIENDEEKSSFSHPLSIIWGVINHLLIVSITLWVQSVVTEDRFVPALNVLSTHLNIPPDVAAATLMAGGTALPNLLAVVVSMFVTHSTLGIGTIIGSEMFQQLFCVAGAILSTRGGEGLALSPETTVREVLFFALSIALLFRALRSDVRPAEDDEEFAQINITILDSALLLIAYVIYVLVCVHFEKIRSLCRRAPVATSAEDEASNKAVAPNTEPVCDYSRVDEEKGEALSSSIVVEPSIPFLRQVRNEPSINFRTSKMPGGKTLLKGEQPFIVGSFSHDLGVESGHQKKLDPVCTSDVGLNDYSDITSESEDVEDRNSPWLKKKKRGKLRRLLPFCVMQPPDGKGDRPSKLHDLEELVLNESTGELSCFLWQQSVFYDHTHLVGRNAWLLRWFTISSDGTEILSYPDRTHFEDHSPLIYPRLNRVELDSAHLVFRLHSAVEGGPEYVMMAPSVNIMNVVISGIKSGIQLKRQASFSFNRGEEFPSDEDKSPSLLENEVLEAEMEALPSFIDHPRGASPFVFLLHYILYPIKLFMHCTIPDVRTDDPTKHGVSLFHAILSILGSVVWVVVATFIMVMSLEKVGKLLKMPESIIGITISAVGTSIPIFIASMVSARRGLGNMAVSNAIGSNTFNILVGLGLPWLIYGFFYGTYQFADEDISDSMVILVCSLMLFVVMVVFSRFVLENWHGWILAVIYFTYITFMIVQVYVET